MYRSVILSLISGLMIISCSLSDEESDAYGNFEATEVFISAEVPGKMIHIDVEEGETLKKNQLICLIDTIPYYLKRNQLLAQRSVALSKAEQVKISKEVLMAQKKVVDQDFDRIQKMFADKAATQKQIDDVSGQLDVLKRQLKGQDASLKSVYSEIEVIDAQLAEIEDQLSRCQVTAPSDGVVLQKIAEQGELVATGKPIIKIANINTLFLRAYISGSQLPAVKIGQEVNVIFDKDEDDNQSIKGSVSWISSSAEFTPKIIQTKEERVDLVYAIKVLVKNDGRLKIGMPGEVKF